MKILIDMLKHLQEQHSLLDEIHDSMELDTSINLSGEIQDFLMVHEAKLLSDEAFDTEREHLFKHYTKLPDDIADDIQSIEIADNKVAVAFMNNKAKVSTVPSRDFINKFQTALEALPEPGGDSQEYANWATAGRTQDGENFIYDLDIFEWIEYYEHNN